MHTRSSIKLGASDDGIRCSGEEVMMSVRRSSAKVANLVSSSTSRLMRLDRLFAVDTAKTSVAHGQQPRHPRVRIKLCGEENG